MMGLTEKMYVLDELCSNMSYMAVAMSILNKVSLNRNIQNKVMCWSVDENVT